VLQKTTIGSKQHRFLQAGCPFCHPTDSVEALKETQDTDLNQWPDLILFLSVAGPLREAALVLLCWVANAVLLSGNNLRQVVHTCASVTKQYKLTPVKGRCITLAMQGLDAH